MQKKNGSIGEETEVVVRTSVKDWLERSLKLYKDKAPFVFIDDAGVGITQKDLESAVSLIRAAKTKGKLDFKSIASVLAGIGLSGAGIWMIAAAVADPEPTSKLGLLIAGGIVITLTGGIGTLSALGVRFVITGRGSSGSEFKIEPKE
ncbi:MAG: hypothetical protein JW765_07180 [Deltaproteobacteria bacterium]|nr:hypothetical protein [Candidatus Zymogenaceae bacterium]